jgi:hypothetical protein
MVVLSTTIKEELPGTLVWYVSRYAVPPPLIALLIDTVIVAAVAVTLVAIMVSILLTVPADGVNAVQVVAVVVVGTR